MAERLTKRTPKGASLKLDNPRNEAEARKQLMGEYKIAVEKLAHYEDLKEQNRLLVLPKNITLDMLVETMCNYRSGCPSNLGLKENCKLSCEKCWLAALKGVKE